MMFKNSAFSRNIWGNNMHDYKTRADVAKPVSAKTAVLGMTLTFLAAIGAHNIHRLEQGEVGELQRDGKTVSTTQKEGIYFTVPLREEFIKWKWNTKTTSHAGETLDGRRYEYKVSAAYHLPSSHAMEDHRGMDHQFVTNVARAFNDTIANRMSKDIAGPHLETAARIFCNEAAKSLPSANAGETVKPPRDVRCHLRTSGKTASVTAKF